MDFYKDRKAAIVIIRQMCNEGKELEAIQYKIACKFGFGKKFVNEIIELDLNLKNKDIHIHTEWFAQLVDWHSNKQIW